MNFHTPSAVDGFKVIIYLKLSDNLVSHRMGWTLFFFSALLISRSQLGLEIAVRIQKVNFLCPETH